MKTLVLLRHIKSGKITIKKDFDRPVTDHRRSDMLKVGTELQATKFWPERILCSPALRTRQTAEEFCKLLKLDFKQVKFVDELYEAEVSDLRFALNDLPDSVSSVVIVGHNPSMTEAASQLSNSIIENVPTCAMVGISFDEKSWKKALEKGGKLKFFFTPKDGDD